MTLLPVIRFSHLPYSLRCVLLLRMTCSHALERIHWRVAWAVCKASRTQSTRILRTARTTTRSVLHLHVALSAPPRSMRTRSAFSIRAAILHAQVVSPLRQHQIPTIRHHHRLAPPLMMMVPLRNVKHMHQHSRRVSLPTSRAA